jgi:mannosyltransferase OCH1-like enzyme
MYGRSLELPAVNFGMAMGQGTPGYEKKFILHKHNKARYEDLKVLFDLNYESPVRPRSQMTIPETIHQIWVGGTAVPTKFKKLIKTWKELHPQWEYKLWLDEDVEKLHLRNRVFYDTTSDPIEKANIARYEILEQFGGAYIDIDFLCLKPLDVFHRRYDFYTGIAPTDCAAMLNNALIACGPGHPIIKHCIDRVRDDFSKVNRFERTGVMHYSRSFFARVKSSPGISIALPASFFYPLGKSDKKYYDEETAKPETFAVHYWASTPVGKKSK